MKTIKKKKNISNEEEDYIIDNDQDIIEYQNNNNRNNKSNLNRNNKSPKGANKNKTGNWIREAKADAVSLVLKVLQVLGYLVKEFLFAKLALNSGHLCLFHFADGRNSVCVKSDKAGTEVCSARVDYDHALVAGLFFRRKRPSADHVLVGLFAVKALVHVV